jgi:flagellar hook-associated protein 1 FlgK
MNSTFMGLEIGKRGLQAHQQALHVTGHNISNAENEEYSRQRVTITAADPIYNPSLNRAETAGQLGQGSVVAQVERVRDTFIDDRIVAEKNSLGYWKSRDDYIYQIENIYNEPADSSIRTLTDELWAAWQELENKPEQRSVREVVQKKAVSLSNRVNHLHTQLDELQRQANREIELRIETINTYAHEIRDLNERIMKAEALGDQPNDLKDRRDAMIEKLSTIVDVSVGRSDEDELIVYIGSENLVQGEVQHLIKAAEDPDNNGYYTIVWDKSETPVHFTGGELAGLMSIRDEVLRENIDDVNSFALNIMDLTNEIHRDGFGKNGRTNLNFFREIPMSENVEGNVDLNNDGVDDVSAVFKVAGRNTLDASAAIGVAGTMTFMTNDGSEALVPISYVETDSVNSVIEKINSAKLGVVAYVNHNGNFALKSTAAKDTQNKNFMIRHIEDDGQFLVGLTGILQQSGQVGAYEYTELNAIRNLAPTDEHITLTPRKNPAAYMNISLDIKQDVDNIAAARGRDTRGTGDFDTTNGIGDGSNALMMANVFKKNNMVETNATFQEFYTSLISRIGVQGEETDERVENQETLLANLDNLRQSVSGVSLDEEMANMVAYQHGYNASARMISTVDKMLETIIQLGR